MTLKSFFAASSQPTLASLKHDHVPAILELIETVRLGLEDEQKHFLKPKTPAELADLLNNGGVIFSIMGSNNAPIALTIVNCEKQKTATLQSVCVHPDHKGQGHMKALMQHIEEWAREEGISLLIAKVACANTDSCGLFNKGGFRVVRRGQDPDMGYPFNIFAKTIPPLANPAPVLSNEGYERRFAFA